MASYLELHSISTNADLMKRAQVAVLIACDKVLADNAASPQPANQSQRMAWASKALSEPQSEGQRALFCVLAQNADLTVAQLTSASDASLQAAVDAAIDLLAVR